MIPNRMLLAASDAREIHRCSSVTGPCTPSSMSCVYPRIAFKRRSELVPHHGQKFCLAAIGFFGAHARAFGVIQGGASLAVELTHRPRTVKQERRIDRSGGNDENRDSRLAADQLHATSSEPCEAQQQGNRERDWQHPSREYSARVVGDVEATANPICGREAITPMPIASRQIAVDTAMAAYWSKL